MNPNSKAPDLFVDNTHYQWPKPTITGAEIRTLASVPAGVNIFLKVPGHPDKPILDDTVVDLTARKSPEHFSTQATGSQAG